MKAVITTQGDSSYSEVDPRFGRARHCLVYDTETETYTPVPETRNLHARQDGGIQAGRIVPDAAAPRKPGVLPACLHPLGATVIICGEMGMGRNTSPNGTTSRSCTVPPGLPAEKVIRAHLDGNPVTGDNIFDP